MPHGIIEDVPNDFSNHIIENDLGNGFQLKRDQDSGRPLPVLGVIFKS